MALPKDFTFTDYDPYNFADRRHIGPSPAEMAEMLKVVGYDSLDALIDDPHLAAVGLIRTIEQPGDGEVRLVGPAATWSRTPPSIHAPAPRLGEHGAEILREAGFAEAEIEDLRTAGALSAQDRS